ncbi:BMA_0021/BMA_0022 family TOMM bacteriocin [Massilia mucilaginosa]|nr:BMA_0021/BMA_0022 family TOMM bacteriocin [Massilia mucilaginosa]
MIYRPASSNYDTFLQYRALIIRAIALAWKDPAFKSALYATPKEALKESLRYDFPYDMELAVIPNSASWRPELNAGWICHTQNVVGLTLPPRPEPGEEAVALAEYNARFLTFLTNL